jgi:hypothetical protein
MERLRAGILIRENERIEMERRIEYITVTFLLPYRQLLKPEVLYNPIIDQPNTNLMAENIKHWLEDLNDREATIWNNYELGADFLCDYLNCESITLSKYVVRNDKVLEFLINYQKKGN